MEGMKLKTESGIEVDLTLRDVLTVFAHYIEERVRERVKESCPDWAETSVETLIAYSMAEIDVGDGTDANLWGYDALYPYEEGDGGLPDNIYDFLIVSAIRNFKYNLSFHWEERKEYEVPLEFFRDIKEVFDIDWAEFVPDDDEEGWAEIDALCMAKNGQEDEDEQ